MTERLSSIHLATTVAPDHDPRVIVPDVFPSASNPGTHLSQLHDIIRGHVPSENHFRDGRIQEIPDFDLGWLRIANSFGKTPAYIDPADPNAKDKLGLHRPCQNIPIQIDSVKDIERHSLPLTLALKSFGASYFRPDIDPLLGNRSYKVETVRTFVGRVANNSSLKVIGVHVPSHRQHGWARLWREH